MRRVLLLLVGLMLLSGLAFGLQVSVAQSIDDQTKNTDDTSEGDNVDGTGSEMNDSQETVPTPNKNASGNQSICVDKCGDGVCQKEVCTGADCPCIETLQSCPEDCSENVPENASKVKERVQERMEEIRQKMERNQQRFNESLENLPENASKVEKRMKEIRQRMEKNQERSNDILEKVEERVKERSQERMKEIRQKKERNQERFNETLENLSEKDKEVHRHGFRVSNAVHSLLATENWTGGIGEEVSQIAQDINKSVNKTVEAEQKINNRGGFSKFLFGGDEKAAEKIQSQVNKNQQRLQRLEQSQQNCNCSEEVKNMMQEQIQEIEQEQQRLQQVAQEEKQNKGLLGWLWK